MLFRQKKERKPTTTELLDSGLFVDFTLIGSDNSDLAVTKEDELYQKANADDGSVLFSLTQLKHPEGHKKYSDGWHHYFHLNGHHFGASCIRYTDFSCLDYEPLEQERLLMQYENTLIRLYADIVEVFHQYGYLKWIYTFIMEGSPYEQERY